MTDSTDHPLGPWPADAHLQPEQLLEHVDWVRRLAVRLVRDEHTAEDLAQRTLMTALRRPPRADRGSIRGWLARVLTNEARTEHRGRGRRRDREETVSRERGALTEDPAEIDRRFELQRALFEAVDRLDGPQRSAIVLRYFEDLTPREIAERLGEPLRTVETRLHRARLRLRQVLDSEYGRRDSWAVLALPAVIDTGARAAKGALASSSVSVTPPLAAGLVFMSAKTILIAVACVGALVLGIRQFSGGSAAPDVRTANEVGDADVVLGPGGATPALVAPAATAAGDARVAAGPAAEDADTETSGAFPPDTPMCTVRGTVVDVAGKPLAGSDVTLCGFGGWRDGLVIPRLEGRDEWFGFAAKTSVDGTFSIEAPVPTVSSTRLRILPDPFHDSYTKSFGPPPLVEGVRDMRTIRLASAGVLSGLVTDSRGLPIEGVNVRFESSAAIQFGREAWTDANGQYLVAHVPAGECSVSALPERHMHAVSGPHLVEAGKTTGSIDFVLEDAPRISGVVRDDRDAPVEGAWVGAMDSDFKQASTQSLADGSFTLFLPATGSYLLSVGKSGYVLWGDLFSGPIAYPAGTTDLDITLTWIEPTTFRVIDADSGASIERFGLEIHTDGGSEGVRSTGVRSVRYPRGEDHPGGTTQASARERVDAYVVMASGYLPSNGDVVHDEGGTRVQTIHLQRGRTVKGRATRRGLAVPSANVSIVRGNVRRRFRKRTEDAPIPEVSEFTEDRITELSASTDADGRFVLDGLGGGLHRLRIRMSDGSSAEVFPIHVDAEDVDLGDVEIAAPGSITGRVLVLDGADPSGITVRLNRGLQNITAVTDVEGRFQFEAVTVGDHSVDTVAREGDLAATTPTPVVVEAGGVSTVTIDARDRAMTEVELTVLINGEPAAGYQVGLVGSDPDEKSRKNLGASDDSGRVRGSVRAWGDARVAISRPPLHGLTHPTARLALVAGVPVVETIRFELASVALRFPEDIDFPAEGELLVWLKPSNGDALVTLRFKMRSGAPTSEFEGVFDAIRRTITVPLIPPGCHGMFCALVDDSTGVKTTLMSNNTVLTGGVPYFERQIDVEAKLGETVTVDL